MPIRHSIRRWRILEPAGASEPWPLRAGTVIQIPLKIWWQILMDLGLVSLIALTIKP